MSDHEPLGWGQNATQCEHVLLGAPQDMIFSPLTSNTYQLSIVYPKSHGENLIFTIGFRGIDRFQI